MKSRISKFLSIILAFTMLLTVCFVSTVSAAGEHNYYVMAGGTGDGSSPASPVATVADAVAKINEAGLAAGDTANVYIMQNASWDDAKNTVFGSGSTLPHKMTAWSADGTMTAHKATIVIKKYTGSETTLDNGKAYLAFTPNLGENKSMFLGGPTVFEDVTIVATYGYDGGNYINTNGCSAEFNPETEFTWDAVVQYWGNQKWTGNYSYPFYVATTDTYDHSANSNYTDYVGEASVALKNSQFNLIIGSRSHISRTHPEDYNVVIDNASASSTVYWGSGHAYGQVTFAKNLNINVKNATKITNQLTNSDCQVSTVNVNGAIQIIYNNSSTVVENRVSDLSNITVTGGIYEITDTHNVLSFTDTAGVFNVSGGVKAAATNESGLKVETNNGVLTLPSAGKWTVTVPKIKDYYVMSGGTGDGSSPASPVATVADAVAKINSDGLTAGDTANVYIMQNENWNTYNNGNIGNDGTNRLTQPHNMTAWSADGTMTAHTAKIVIKKYAEDSSNNGYLAFTSNLGQNASMIISGPTVFEDVTLVCMRKTYAAIVTNDNDVTFSSNTAYGGVNVGEYEPLTQWDGKVVSTTLAVNTAQNNVTYTKEATVNLNSGVNFYLGNGSHVNNTYKDSFTLNVDLPGKSQVINVGSGHAAGRLYFNKNLNINIKNASQITYQKLTNGSIENSTTDADGNKLYYNDNDKISDTVYVYGDIQLIYNADTKVTDDIEKFDFIRHYGGVYKIINESNNSDLLSFTSKSGVYSVAEGCVAYATDKNGTVYRAENNILTLPEAGEYTVNISKVKDYYVMAGGTGDGSSPASPVATVADAVAKINEAGLAAGDTANVYIMQNASWDDAKNTVFGSGSTLPHKMTAWSADGTMTAHKATIVIKKYTGSETTLDNGKAYLAFTPNLGENKSMFLGGPTVFEDVTIVATYGYDGGNYINTNGCSAEFNPETEFTWDGVVQYWGNQTWTGNWPVQFYVATTDTYDHSKNQSYTDYVGEASVALKNSQFNLIIGSRAHIDRTHPEDYNVVIDNASASSTVYWGSGHEYGKVTFAKNLNINVKNATKITNQLTNSNCKVSTVNVNGAIQIIYNNSSTVVENRVSDLSNITVTGGIYEITDTHNVLSFTDTAGQFKVAQGYAVAATNGTDTVYSQNGVLTLPSAGSWTVTESYKGYSLIDGVLTVYDTALDFADIMPDEQENKLFVGWVREDGTAPTGETLNFGDKLTAKFVDYTDDDFKMSEAQVRDSDSLRFIFQLNTAKLEGITITEKGALTLPTDVANGGEFFIDKAYVKSWDWNTTIANGTGDAANIADYRPATYGARANKIAADNILHQDDNNIYYTLCITGLTGVDSSATFYGARGYFIYNDLNGVSHTVYTVQRQSSLYKAAAENLNSPDLTACNAITTAYKAARTTTALDSLYNKTAISGVAGTEDTDPNHLLYDYVNKNDAKDILRIGEANINLGSAYRGINTEILFFTDPHLSSASEIDAAGEGTYANLYNTVTGKDNNITMATYRNRTWGRNGGFGPIASKVMNFGSYFGKMVMGGDAVDYYSDGGIKMAYRLLTEKSVNGSLKMLFGNHELGLASQVSGSEFSYTHPERELLRSYISDNNYWANNTLYDSEVYDGVKLIYMDNGSNLENGSFQFVASQYTALQKDINDAKANNQPVIIFTHVPMNTFNEAYNTVYYYEQYDYSNQRSIKNYGTATHNTGSISFNNFKEWVGDDTDTEVTMNVCNLIRENADIIKAVVNGHMHEWIYTEISGSGVNADKVIPQYNVAGAHSGDALRIKITCE